jgi:two-component system, NarL family, invasion response regulator UvrY
MGSTLPTFFVEPELAQQLVMATSAGMDDAERIQLLSPREFDVFCLLANGYTTQKAADKLCLSYKPSAITARRLEKS